MPFRLATTFTELGSVRSLSQQILGEKQDYALARSAVHHRTHRFQSHIDIEGQFRVSNQSEVHVFGLREETGVTGNPPDTFIHF